MKPLIPALTKTLRSIADKSYDYDTMNSNEPVEKIQDSYFAKLNDILDFCEQHATDVAALESLESKREIANTACRPFRGSRLNDVLDMWEHEMALVQ